MLRKADRTRAPEVAREHVAQIRLSARLEVRFELRDIATRWILCTAVEL